MVRARVLPSSEDAPRRGADRGRRARRVDADDWESLRAGWEATVHGLARAFASGDAPGCPDRGLYVGAALVFAKPHFKEAFQVSVISISDMRQELLPFLYGYSPAPRAWVGYSTATGLGLRVDYWQYDQAGDSRSFRRSGIQ